MGTDVSRTRSFALIGHAGDGKTTLADSVVMAGGVTNRLGSVDDGTSAMNHLPEEESRRISIRSSLSSFEHNDIAVTLIDTPGGTNFAGELIGCLPAVDHAVLVLSAKDGVRVGTERAYKAAREAGLAVTAVANKMDLDRVDLDSCASQLEELSGARVVKLHLPIGVGQSFEGYVDLLTQRAFTFPKDGSGKADESSVPESLTASQSISMISVGDARIERMSL